MGQRSLSARSSVESVLGDSKGSSSSAMAEGSDISDGTGEGVRVVGRARLEELLGKPGGKPVGNPVGKPVGNPVGKPEKGG